MKEEFKEEVLQNDLHINYSIRAFFPQIIPALLIGVYSFYVWTKVPSKGLYLYHFFRINLLTPLEIFTIVISIWGLNKIFLGKKNLLLIALGIISSVLGFMYLKYPKYVVSADVMDIVLFSLIAMSLLIVIYYLIYAKTGFITVNQRTIEVSQGVFNRIKDTTDLTEIRDKDFTWNFLERILGLAKVRIQLNRLKEIIWIQNITLADATKLHDYLKAYAFSTSREYWATRDRARDNKGGSQTGKGKDLQRFIEDGQGENEFEDGFED